MLAVAVLLSALLVPGVVFGFCLARFTRLNASLAQFVALVLSMVVIACVGFLREGRLHAGTLGWGFLASMLAVLGGYMMAQSHRARGKSHTDDSESPE